MEDKKNKVDATFTNTHSNNHHIDPLGEWDTCGLFRKWTFTVANQMIHRGLASPLQYDDMMQLPDDDEPHIVTNKIEHAYEDIYNSEDTEIRQTELSGESFMPRLMKALITAFQPTLLFMTALTITEGQIRISAALSLKYLLEELSDPSSSDYSAAYGYAGLLGGLTIFHTIVHHVLFFWSMRVGWNMKIGTIGAIFNRLFKLDPSKSSNASTETGRLVNLVSNDVFRFEVFFIFAPFFFAGPIELIVIYLILIFELNAASATAGIACTVMFVPLQLYLAKVFTRVRTNTASRTDERVRHISEIISGIMSVKANGWEEPFLDLVGKSRKAESDSISIAQFCKSINFSLYYFMPPLSAFVTFSTYVATGGELTLPVVFSSLALLQVLKVSINRHFTNSLEMGSEAFASARRIQTFLEDVDGKDSATIGNSNNRSSQ